MRRGTDLTDFQRSLDLDRIYVKGHLSGLSSPCGPETLRILTWNIARGRQPERIARILTEIRPDIACLQEVDWGNERTRFLDVLQFLAERTGMIGLFGIEFFEVCSPLRPAKLAGGGVTGNAVLTRFEPAMFHRVDLPACIDWRMDAEIPALPSSVRRCVRREKRIGSRSGICVEFMLNGQELVVCSIHLEDKAGGVAGRWAQYLAAVQAIEARRGSPAACVIAGDFNTFDSPIARLLAKHGKSTALGKPDQVTEAAWWKTALLPRTGYADPFAPAASTFTVPPLFRAKLDWITTNAGKVRNGGIGPFASSDHRPIWIDVDFPREHETWSKADRDAEQTLDRRIQ